MELAFVLDLAEHGARNLWLVQDPSTWGLLIAGLLGGAGLIALGVLLRRDDEERAPAPDPVAAELSAIRTARGELLSELETAPPALRGALRPLLEGPLLDYDERVASLVETARGRRAQRTSRSVDDHRAQLLVELEAEDDPRARALIEASLGDLDATRKLQQDLARNGRLALLELRRMKTLLTSLPARVRELASRQGLDQGHVGDVEAIARQLEGAVDSTQEVMEGALAPPTDSLPR